MAQVDTPEFIDSALQVYHTEVRKSIRLQEERLQQLQTAHDQLQQTIDTVQELPQKLRHQVMVPFGKHAFFPGQLTHTNELIVHLGDQYYVEVTAAAARGILQRKLAVIADGLHKAQQQLQALKARLKVTQSSLKDDSSSSEEPIEIRSTLEESDAILSTARGGGGRRQKQQAAAAQADLQQRPGQAPQMKKTAAGYSYTPVGTAEGSQQRQQQGLDLDDAALQARLEELMLLEEQQELEELEQQQQQQPMHTVLQQQQHQQPPLLDTIAEGSEGEEDQQSADLDTAAEPAAAGAPGRAAGARADRLAAAQRLQELEAEADSDDDEQQEQQQQQRRGQAMSSAVGPVVERVHEGQDSSRQQKRQQHTPQLGLAAVGPVMERMPGAHGHQPEQQQQHGQHQELRAGAPSPSSGQAATAARKPLKSALKKGFLTSAAAAAPTPTSASDAAAAAGRVAGGSTPLQQKSKSISSPAFTGAVVERPSQPEVAQPTSAAAAPAVGPVLERPVVPSSAAADSSAGGRVSKFKLRRMGLEPHPE